ncbi:MAG: RidA family protein [Candidatus Thorarchaeota archaeon]
MRLIKRALVLNIRKKRKLGVMEIIKMEKKRISSGSPYEKPIGFSRAVRIGNIISVSGTAAIAPDGSTMHPNDAYGQTKYCIEIMKKAIEAAGGSLSNVIRTRIMLTNIAKWEQAAKAHGEFFSNIRPACTFVEVKAFVSPEWLVETEADCVLDTE